MEISIEQNIKNPLGNLRASLSKVWPSILVYLWILFNSKLAVLFDIVPPLPFLLRKPFNKKENTVDISSPHVELEGISSFPVT